MSRIILRLAILSAGLFIADYLLAGIHTSGYGPIVKAALVLGIVNLLIKPVLFILTLPVTILTLGLFALVLNGLLLWFVSVLVNGFDVAGPGSAILGALIVSIVSIVANRLVD